MNDGQSRLGFDSIRVQMKGIRTDEDSCRFRCGEAFGGFDDESFVARRIVAGEISSDISEIKRVEAELSVFTSPKSLIYHEIDVSVVLHRGDPTGAADQAKSFHILL